MVPTITATELDTSFGITEATLVFTGKSDLIVTAAMIELRDGRTLIQLTNPSAHTFTISHGAVVASFKIPTHPDKQIRCNQCHWNNSLLSLHSQRKPTTSSTSSSRLTAQQTMVPVAWDVRGTQEPQPGWTTDLRWNPSTPWTRNLDPTLDGEHRKFFLDQFSWKDSQLTPEEQAMVELLHHWIFARHRFDKEISNEFKVNSTPKHDELVYAHNLPTPTNLRDEMLVELVLQQEYSIFTTLRFSKDSLPIFVQSKLEGKLRILVDLRRIYHFIKDDYNEHNHPVTTTADAARHMAGKKYFCKLDCS